jgi:ferredoxin
MIVTRQKESEKILEMLEGKERVFIVGCGDCAATCKTGGEPEVKAMAAYLSAHGKTVTGMAVPDVTCISAQAKIVFAKNRAALKEAQAVVVLACGSGVQTVTENDRLNLDVYPGCDSLYAATIASDGAMRQVCSACGECILDLTEAVCPVTRCSKGLLNGPCGGQDQGHCEVDPSKDCAWILIYKKMKEKGRLDVLRQRRKPRNYCFQKKPDFKPETLAALSRKESS